MVRKRTPVGTSLAGRREEDQGPGGDGSSFRCYQCVAITWKNINRRWKRLWKRRGGESRERRAEKERPMQLDWIDNRWSDVAHMLGDKVAVGMGKKQREGLFYNKPVGYIYNGTVRGSAGTPYPLPPHPWDQSWAYKQNPAKSVEGESSGSGPARLENW